MLLHMNCGKLLTTVKNEQVNFKNLNHEIFERGFSLTKKHLFEVLFLKS